MKRMKLVLALLLSFVLLISSSLSVLAEENNGMDSSQPILASNQQDNLADDMPDYMNDVDVSTI